MIDAIQPDFALLKEASQTRETLEEKEARLKRMKNFWIGLFFINLIVFIVFQFVLPLMNFVPDKWRLLAYNHPFVIWFLIAAVIYLLILIIYFSVSCSSVKSKAEMARKKEWNLLLKLNRNLTNNRKL